MNRKENPAGAGKTGAPDMHDDRLCRAREEINRVDREMAALFCRRMEAVEQVAAYKSRHGLPILDAAREEEVVRRNAAEVAGEMQGYYTEFLRDTMKISRDYQRRLTQGMRVAFSGVAGAFAAIAAGKIFPGATRVPYGDFRAAYDAAVEGECDVVVLPIENSTAGEVGAVLDMMFSGPLYVNGVYDLSVTHHLLGIPGSRPEGVREVISHPQALMQCAPYIRAHGYATREFENTAAAALYVAEKLDPTVAAIASEETAALYGLEILDKNIHTSNLNTTRFAVLARAAARPAEGGDRHSILMFTVRNEAGSLAQAINIIGRYGFNMRCLRSRPMKELLWQYYFYVEAEGDLSGETGRRMQEEMASCCDRVRVYGSFRYPAELH